MSAAEIYGMTNRLL